MGYVGEEGNGYKHFYDKHFLRRVFQCEREPKCLTSKEEILSQGIYRKLHTITMTGAV